MRKKNFIFAITSICMTASLVSCASEGKTSISDEKPLVSQGESSAEEVKHQLLFYVDNEIYAIIKSNGYEMIEMPKDPIKENYSFEGWYFEKDYTNAFKEDSFLHKEITKDINIYAKFESTIDATDIEKQINFYVDDNLYFQILTNGNEPLSLPKAPEKKEHRFAGWFLENTYATPFNIQYYETHPLEDSLDVFAKFSKESELVPIQKQINFYVDDDLYHQILTNGNETLTLPNDPQKQGYTFQGWFLDQTYQEKFDISYYIEHELKDSLDVYGQFVQNTYIVSFETNGGLPLKPFEGTVLNEAPTPVKENYIFLGWFFDSNLSNKASFPLVLTQNITLYAKYKENEIVKAPFEIDASGVIVKYNDLTSKVVNVPEQIDGKEVLGLASSLFADNEVIEEVTLPKTLKNLGCASFKNAVNLKKVTLQGEKVNTIPSSCFENCTNLSEIKFIDSIAYINANSFANCSLQEFIAPKNLRSIGNEAFLNNKKLINVSFGNVRNIFRSAFEGCTSLTEVNLPDTLENLDEDYVFYKCTNLTKATLPKKTMSISKTIFNETKLYQDQSNWTNNGLYVDHYLITLKKDFNANSYIVNEGTKVIAKSVFSQLTSLTEVKLPESVEVLSDLSFAYSNNISKVNIPNSVKKIGLNAFYGTAIYKDRNNYYQNALYYGNWLLAVENVTSDFIKNFVVKEGTTGIADGDLLSYSTRSQLETLTLNEGLKYIGSKAFTNTNLKELNIPDSVSYIGFKSFFGTQIKEITIPQSTICEENSFNADTLIQRK